MARSLQILCALTCIAAAHVHAVMPAARGDVPILFEDNRVYVPVVAGAQPPRWFILDTGATQVILDAAFVRELGLAVRGDRVVSGAGPGQSHQQRTDSVALRIGSVDLASGADTPVAELSAMLGPTGGRAPAGIIGAPLFHDHIVAIDFAHQRLTFYAADAELGGSYAARVPLRIVDHLPFAPVRIGLPGTREVEAKALVDLGAKATLLVPEPYIAKAHLRDAFVRTVTSGLGAGVGGDTRYAFARARFVGFAHDAALRVDEPIVGLSVDGTLKSGWHDGLLGAEFLARFRVAFDYSHSRLLLAPDTAEHPEYDMSGMFLVAAGDALDRIVVRDVLADGPAHDAGLHANDEIVAIDATPVASLGLAKVRVLLKSVPQRTFVLRVTHDGEARNVRITLRRLI